MGRRKLDNRKKRKQISISVRPDILELAERTDNSSRFFERSVECANGIRQVIEKIQSGEFSNDRAWEEIEDIVDNWDAQFDEGVPLGSIPRHLSEA